MHVTHSPQAMERHTTARNSFLAEEEELCKLLKSLDEATAAAAAAAAGLASPAAPGGAAAAAGAGGGAGAGGKAVSTTAEAVAGAGVVVPRLAAGLGTAAFKQLVLTHATPSDLKVGGRRVCCLLRAPCCP